MDNTEIIAVKTVQDIQSFLFDNRDNAYKNFTKKLIPTIKEEKIIGVRTPVLRKLAKSLSGEKVCDDYLNTLPHTYLEENHLHGFLIENVKDFTHALSLIEEFLPYIDNWATCDSVRPKALKKDTDTLYEHIKVWIASDSTYTIRYGIGMLLSFYLDEAFNKEHLKLVSEIRSDEYYVNMMIAWYFATALAKQYNCAFPYIESKVLPPWTHNKTISKALESYRIGDKLKAKLKTLKIKS